MSDMQSTTCEPSIMSIDPIVEMASLPVSEESRPAGLSSPPDSNNALKLDGSDSELSDIEEPEEDIGEVSPDRYEGGVPIFTPSMEQFKSFSLYMKKINHIGMKTGIVKVIPPKEWRDSLPPLDEAIKTIKVKDPIAQEIMGTGGTYRQVNIQHQRSYNLPQWRQLCEQSEHQPPAKRGERRANQDNTSRLGLRSKGTLTGSASKRRGPGRPIRKPSNIESPDVLENSNENSDRLPTPVSPPVKAEDDLEAAKNDADDEGQIPTKGKASRQPKAIASVSSRRKYNRREAAGKIDEAAFQNFEYRLVSDEYTKERCEELERAYWKTLTYAPPLYGADMPGSLFDESVTSWNLGKLENLLDILGTKIPGVNTAYLYLGMWKATFAWHLEDVDLYSINYNHFGAPKQWYSIAQKDARRFEAAMKGIWPVDAKACDQFLRHKTFLISPTTLLEKYNVKVNKVVHHPGEFVITFPYGYHSGFNLGYNAAEAVNFAMESWLELGRVAKKCDCDQAQDSVWIDAHDMRKLRGEETEFEESEDDDDEGEEGPTDLPTPPGSSGDTKTPRRKRKRPIKEVGGQIVTKRIRIRIPAKQPCVLCPNDIPSEELLPTDDGNKAHRICAQYVPETEIEPGTTELVTGTRSISKARLELKCNYCRSKKGAAFQCSQKKCTRAYHATCAAAAGVFVEEGERPVFGPDGTEYKEHAFEFSCRFHRVKRDKKSEGDVLEEDQRIKTRASSLVVGDKCQFQYYRGDIFAGVVVENRKLEEILLVKILPRGECVEVGYKWLLLEDAADYRMAKPSANAIPLPPKSKQSLVTSKRQANDLPRKEDPFLPGYTWEEFNTFKLERNHFQTKVDLSKADQVWFYLGKNSTDAKAQFTEDPRKPRHNPKGHFLDTIPKAIPASSSRHSYPASYPSSGVNQNALNAARASSRPSLPHNNSRLEKPYEYKPRGGGESYRPAVDPQAYRNQQKFLQNSVPPYAFGSDPRWPSPNDRYSGSYGAYRPSAGYGSTSLSMMSPASAEQSHSRPTTGHQAPTKSGNPFTYPVPRNNSNIGRSNNGGRSYSMPNPFAKYPYLQKQHNRSPMDYKSPYSQNGGFMNGYEGDLKEHLRRNPDVLFGTQRSPSQSSPITPNPLLNYSNSLRQSQTPALPYSPSMQSSTSQSGSTKAPVSLYISGSHQPGSNSSGQFTPNQQTPSAHHTVKPVSSTVWEKRDSCSLHPAIRQEYGSMFHHQYQPQPQTGRASQPSQSGHHSAHPSSATPQQYHTANSPQQSYQSRMAGPEQSQFPVLQGLTPFAQSYHSQQPQQSEDKKPLYAHQQYFKGTQQHNQPFVHPLRALICDASGVPLNSPTPLDKKFDIQTHGQPNTQPQPRKLDVPAHSKNLVDEVVDAQQQVRPFAETGSPAPKVPDIPKDSKMLEETDFQIAQPQIQPPLQSQALTRDVPDVPPDSTTLVEKMMADLRSISSRQG